MATDNWEEDLGKKVLESAEAAVDESKAMGRSLVQLIVPTLLVLLLGAGVYWLLSREPAVETTAPSAEEIVPTVTEVVEQATASVSDRLRAYLTAKPTEETGATLPIFPFERLRFAAGTAEPVTGDWAEVDELAEVLRAHPGLVVEIAGHLGAEGTEADRLRLTNERTALVKLRLLELGVAASQITARGYGAKQPSEGAAPPWQRLELRLVQR